MLSKLLPHLPVTAIFVGHGDSRWATSRELHTSSPLWWHWSLTLHMLSVTYISDGQIIWQKWDSPFLCGCDNQRIYVFSYIRGGGWMWESIKHEDQDLLYWLVETISKGTAIFVTNNLSNKRKHAPLVSGASWLICFKGRSAWSRDMTY